MIGDFKWEERNGCLVSKFDVDAVLERVAAIRAKRDTAIAVYRTACELSDIRAGKILPNIDWLASEATLIEEIAHYILNRSACE